MVRAEPPPLPAPPTAVSRCPRGVADGRSPPPVTRSRAPVPLSRCRTDPSLDPMHRFLLGAHPTPRPRLRGPFGLRWGPARRQRLSRRHGNGRGRNAPGTHWWSRLHRAAAAWRRLQGRGGPGGVAPPPPAMAGPVLPPLPGNCRGAGPNGGGGSGEAPRGGQGGGGAALGVMPGAGVTAMVPGSAARRRFRCRYRFKGMTPGAAPEGDARVPMRFPEDDARYRRLAPGAIPGKRRPVPFPVPVPGALPGGGAGAVQVAAGARAGRAGPLAGGGTAGPVPVPARGRALPPPLRHGRCWYRYRGPAGAAGSVRGRRRRRRAVPRRRAAARLQGGTGGGYRERGGRRGVPVLTGWS